MSRIANLPVAVPDGVQVTLAGGALSVKGPKGELSMRVNDAVDVRTEDKALRFAPRTQGADAVALTGTARALANNMIAGVTRGFEKRLELVGVGYRAQSQGKTLNLTLGLSHPVNYPVPDGITIDTPSQTEVVVRGCDRQKVGQVAAEIRGFRPPEPYKGKGVRYSDEHVVRKEAKKK